MDKITISGYTKSENIKWTITAILTAITLLIPEGGYYSHEIKLFLAVTVFGLALMAFEIVPTMYISFLMPVAWVVLGCAPIEVILSNFNSSMFLMLAGALFLGATLEDCGLLRRIAFAMMCVAKGNYFILMVCIFVTGCVLNVLAAGMGYLVLAALAAGLCVSLGVQGKKAAVGIMAAAMVGGCTSHVFTYQAGMWGLISNFSKEYTDYVVTPATLFANCWPMILVCLVFLFIVSKWYKPEPLGDVTYFKEELSKMGPLSRREKANIFMLIILMVAIFTVGIHPFDINTLFAVIPWIVYLPFVRGADEGTVKKMNVTMLIFMASCMGIGSVATHLGVGDIIVEVCTKLLNGQTSPYMIMLIVFSLVFILNFAMTPLAIFSLITGPMCMLALGIGYPCEPFLYAINACSEAIIMPYEYVPYLIMYSFGMISMIDFIKVNIVRSIIFFGGFMVLMIPYWHLIGWF